MSTLRWIAVALLAALAVVAAVFIVEIRSAYQRIDGTSTVFAGPRGDIEFSQGGAGPPVLVVHGSGGGYDQGEIIARAVLGDAFRWIAPSRFGYLRSSLPTPATFEDQARAFADLLDHLGVKRVAVVALSHGGPSALHFAILYPERVSSLTLLSCGVASSADGNQAQANRQGDVLAMIFRHDFLYWAVSRFLRRQLMGLMGAPPSVIAGLTGEQRALIDQIIDSMNPVATRSQGVAFDNQAAMPNEKIAAIRAPTLVIHARDDTLQLFRNAEFAAATIPAARALSFDTGGHLVIAVQQAAIQAQTQAFIRSNLSGPRPVGRQ